MISQILKEHGYVSALTAAATGTAALTGLTVANKCLENPSKTGYFGQIKGNCWKDIICVITPVVTFMTISKFLSNVSLSKTE
tara:strand:- start:2362 stop:2607 length:246 start_codon:yes stop_codon:yes gene_type:complete